MNQFLRTLEKHARTNPDTTALLSASSSISNTDLLKRAKTMASWLINRKVRRLGLYKQNSIEWVIIDIACIYANVTTVPIPAFFSDQQIEHVVTSAHLDLIISDDIGRIADLNLALTTDADFVESSLVLWVRGINQSENTCAETKPVTKAQCAKITFTSGTTGTPKGVCLSSDALIQPCTALAQLHTQFKIGSHLTVLPLSTLLENIAGVYVAMMAAKPVHLCSTEELGFNGCSSIDLPLFFSKINELRPTSIIVLPQLLTGLVAATKAGYTLPSSLSFIAVGGGKVSPALIGEARDLGLPIFEGYGLSECGSVVCMNTPLSNKIGSVGKPLPHVEVRIDNSEILVRGNVFSGYLNDTSTTDASDNNSQWLRTGDLGSIDEEGFVYIEGRLKNVMISSYGRNISPEWIESELMKSPQISQCAVFGDDKPFCSAVIVPANNHIEDSQIETLIHSVNSELPDYAQIVDWLRAEQPFSASNGLMTANGQPRRKQIESFYNQKLSALYTRDNPTQPNPFDKRESKPMTFYQELQDSTKDNREHLLSAPIIRRCLEGSFSLEEYVRFLEQAYHHVKHTTPLLMALGSRLPEEKEWLRDAVAEYIEEELGHQEWILDDIKNCGYDKEVTRKSTPNASTELMVAYAYDTIHRNNPVGLFGMVFVLEGTSINLACKAAAKIQQTLSLSDDAVIYLNSHGTLDIKHMGTFESLMGQITDVDDKKAIIHSANMFFRLYADMYYELEQLNADKAA